MGNNSKQVVLSIIGIAILVIAVVGVSFAFFTYSKQGTTNNVITTGSIEFVYEETSASALSLTNQFPQSDEEGVQNSKFMFDVRGTLPSSTNAVNYKVYAVAGAAETGKTRMQNSDISIQVASNNGGVPETAYATAGVLTNAVDTTQGLQIAHGTIAADGTEHRHDYTLTMWVNDSVTISDTDGTKTYRASSGPDYPSTAASLAADITARPVYSTLYYSLKVNVEATDATP